MNKLKYLVVIIFIIAAFFRLHNITETPPGLYPDEAMNGNNALESLSPNGHFKWFYPENNGREGLFINIQALSVYIFGNKPWALRIVSAIFGILTVLGIYLLASEIFQNNKKIALFSSFLTAVSFWHINFSRIGFRAIMAPFFLVFAFYFLLKSVIILKSAVAKNNGKIYAFAALTGLFYGLGFHSYIAYRATPLLLAAGFAYRLFFFKELRLRIIKIFAVFAASSMLTFLPLGIYFLNHPADFFGRTTQISIFNSASPIKDLSINILKTAGMLNFSGDYNWRHNYAGKPELFWPVGILFLIGVIFGIFILLKKESPDYATESEQAPGHYKKFSFLMIFLWIIIASLPIVVSNEGLPHALRAILIIPPIFILAGVGGIWLFEKIKSQILNFKNSEQKLKIFYFLLSAFCLLLILESYNTYFIKWGKSEHTAGAFSQNYVEIGRQLNAAPKDLPKYAIVDTGGVLVRGVPMPAQTVMFITDTFTPEKQKEKNIFYVSPEQKSQIPENARIFTIR